MTSLFVLGPHQKISGGGRCPNGNLLDLIFKVMRLTHLSFAISEREREREREPFWLKSSAAFPFEGAARRGSLGGWGSSLPSWGVDAAAAGGGLRPHVKPFCFGQAANPSLWGPP